MVATSTVLLTQLKSSENFFYLFLVRHLFCNSRWLKSCVLTKYKYYKLILYSTISDLYLLYRTYSSMKELIADYESGDLDSFDVKLALGKAINDILEVALVY